MARAKKYRADAPSTSSLQRRPGTVGKSSVATRQQLADHQQRGTDPEPWRYLMELLEEEYKRLRAIRWRSPTRQLAWEQRIDNLYAKCRNLLKPYRARIQAGCKETLLRAEAAIRNIFSAMQSVMLIIIPCVPCIENQLNGGWGGGDMTASVDQPVDIDDASFEELVAGIDALEASTLFEPLTVPTLNSFAEL